MVEAVFAQARGALDTIRKSMIDAIAAPRESLSPYAPFILSIHVPEEKMREVIGK